jgi:maltooligosyltrehalose trehalohydrolase
VVHANTPEGHHRHLIIENDDNDADLLTDAYDAQWNDDFHHILHTLLTGEAQGYYSDYATEQATMLARVLAQGFAYQGEKSDYRHGTRRGKSSQHLPPSCFINFLQNHDQIGNRAFGERLTTLADPAAIKAAIALMLLCPQIPLLFMGEEVGVHEPFFYFTDYHGALAEAVRQGRREEFAKFPAYRDAWSRLRLPDPNAPEIYARSRPDFANPRAEEWCSLYTQLLHLRHEEITPYLRGTLSDGATAVGPKAVIAHWRLANGNRLSLATNLGTTAVEAQLPASDPVWGEASQAGLTTYTTLAWIEP